MNYIIENLRAIESHCINQIIIEQNRLRNDKITSPEIIQGWLDLHESKLEETRSRIAQFYAKTELKAEFV
jgi:DNA-directed RNA polymerase delta subunit